MTYAEMILPEFEAEMTNTRKVLALVPDDKFDWKAHPTLNTIGWNANHIAEIPGWVDGILTELSWNAAPADGDPYKAPAWSTREQVLDLFDGNVAAARKAIANVKDEAMGVMWSLLLGEGNPLFTLPRTVVMRSFVLSHVIHHRAHLCAYLRLNNLAVPGMYGPSGNG